MARAGDGKQRSNRRRRNNLLQQRVDDEELDRFIARAHAAGFQDHRAYHAALICGEAEIDRRERHDLLRIKGELGKQGSNLNQLAYANDLRVIQDALAAVEQASAEIRTLLA